MTNTVSNQSGQPSRRRSWRTLLVGLLVGILATVGLIVFIGMPLALGHRQDLPLERLYGSAAVDIAARTQAGNQANPLPLQNPRVVELGRNAYTGSCAECHGANGDGKGVFGQSLYPPATDLRAHDTQEKSDAELFWIVKNGLSFAGMPGFANQYDDQSIWALVAYMRTFTNTASSAIAVPSPSVQQIALANPSGDPTQRGAAVYFAQGCQACHGPVGNAPGQLGLRAGGREGANAVRSGRPGMPAYDQNQISDGQLNDLIAYLNTFSGRRG